MDRTFPNRLIILPMGVTSRNAMGECNVVSSIPSWRILEARTIPRAIIIEAAQIVRAENYYVLVQNVTKNAYLVPFQERCR